MSTIEAYVYAPPSETEEQFVSWLRELSSGVKWKYRRWLETPDGECEDADYCVDCAEIQRYINRHQRNGYTHITGWDESFESDSPRWCERCGVHLCHSLTRCGIEQEIEALSQPGLSQPGPLSPGDASIILNFLDGIGDYSREKHWPLIEPYAMRLMQSPCNECEVAADGAGSD